RLLGRLTRWSNSSSSCRPRPVTSVNFCYQALSLRTSGYTALQLFAARVFSHPNTVFMLSRAKTALLPNPSIVGNLVRPNLSPGPAFAEAGNAHAVTPFPSTHVLLWAILAGASC